jgi:hypothetical protein
VSRTSIIQIDQQELLFMQRIPCVLMRGGTSKGPVFLAWDLPAAVAERDELLLNLMGSGHELEIDGIGGGSPQTCSSRSWFPNAGSIPPPIAATCCVP